MVLRTCQTDLYLSNTTDVPMLSNTSPEISYSPFACLFSLCANFEGEKVSFLFCNTRFEHIFMHLYLYEILFCDVSIQVFANSIVHQFISKASSLTISPTLTHESYLYALKLLKKELKYAFSKSVLIFNNVSLQMNNNSLQDLNLNTFIKNMLEVFVENMCEYTYVFQQWL